MNPQIATTQPGDSVLSSSTTPAEKWRAMKDRIRVAPADNDLLYDEQDNRLIDLFSGNGTVWLGHANPRITAGLSRQLDRIWITGGLDTTIRVEAVAAIGRFIPPTHQVAALFSTGMEASEFALRMARAITGKPGVVGFEKSMHGKSLATAFLGWDNHDSVLLPQFCRLSFVSTQSEPEILEELELTLRRQPISAVFVEPI